MQKTRPMAGPCLPAALTHQAELQPPARVGVAMGWGWTHGHLTVGWRAMRLDGAGPDYLLSILSWPKVTSCPQIIVSCESKGSYLGPHSRCGWATVDSSLPQCGFFSSSRRPCPIPVLQALVLWKSSQLVASVAKRPTLQPWSDLTSQATVEVHCENYSNLL